MPFCKILVFFTWFQLIKRANLSAKRFPFLKTPGDFCLDGKFQNLKEICTGDYFLISSINHVNKWHNVLKNGPNFKFLKGFLHKTYLVPFCIHWTFMLFHGDLGVMRILCIMKIDFEHLQAYIFNNFTLLVQEPATEVFTPFWT